MDHVKRERWVVIKAWSEPGQSENDDYFVLNVTKIFDDEGKELKKLLNFGLGKENICRQTRRVSLKINFISTADTEREIINISKTFKNSFLLIGKTKNQFKITHCREPLSPTQLKEDNFPSVYLI